MITWEVDREFDGRWEVHRVAKGLGEDLIVLGEAVDFEIVEAVYRKTISVSCLEIMCCD
jgi:hypothetical protein